MRILALSDVESSYLYDHFDIKNFAGVDLVLAAGDLKADYLSFITTALNVPVLYVHGNHDSALLTHPPEGCICIDDKVYVHKGIRIAGIGGCMLYKGGHFQYTEREMAWRIFKKVLLYRKGIDILLTHSPTFGLGDGKDLAHTGFKCFFKLLDRYSPKFMIHGHQHLNYGQGNRVHIYKTTQIINAYNYTSIDI